MTDMTITPTETAHRLAVQLAQVLGVIAERFAELVGPATDAAHAGDFTLAEQLCADEEHLYDVVARTVLDRRQITDFHASDRLGELLLAVTGVSDLDALLEEISPDRIARRHAWCAARGVDPETGDLVDVELFESTLNR
jgi:hypothetical protein